MFANQKVGLIMMLLVGSTLAGWPSGKSGNSYTWNAGGYGSSYGAGGSGYGWSGKSNYVKGGKGAPPPKFVFQTGRNFFFHSVGENCDNRFSFM